MRLQTIRAASVAFAAMVLASLAGIGAAGAHPHVWVTVETEILHDAQKNITGFQHKWTFDEFYSSFAIQGMDKNGDGKYDREELKELAEVNVTSLKEFGFFTFPKLGQSEVDCLEPRDYWLELNNNVLTLHFTLPLKEPVAKDKLKEFQFAVYDPTFYVAFEFAEKDPIRLAGLTGCKPVISRPQAQTPAKSLSESVFSKNDQLMNFGQQYAENVHLVCGPAS